MPRKRTIDEIKERELLKMSELAELNGVRYGTIKYYSELGLLPYVQYGKRLAKYYPAGEASQKLREILKLRQEGKSISDIIDLYHRHVDEVKSKGYSEGYVESPTVQYLLSLRRQKKKRRG